VDAARLDAQILAQPSLPKAKQWLAVLQYHKAAFPRGAGWLDCLADVFLELHHLIATSARRIRGNPTWDLQGTMTDDTEPLEDRAHRLMRKFQSVNQRDIPERFNYMLGSDGVLYGAIRQMIRLGREIDTMKARGALRINVLVDQKSGTVVEQ
jgi:hypothetical protein